MGNRYYLIAFNMVQGIGPRRLAALTKHFGSLDKAWRAAAQELMRVPGIGRATAMSIAARRGRNRPNQRRKGGPRGTAGASSPLRTTAIPQTFVPTRGLLQCYM